MADFQTTCIAANNRDVNIGIRTIWCSYNYFYKKNDWKAGRLNAGIIKSLSKFPLCYRVVCNTIMPV